eukprot:6896523-Pyramimonas_sp.AAC.1
MEKNFFAAPSARGAFASARADPAVASLRRRFQAGREDCALRSQGAKSSRGSGSSRSCLQTALSQTKSSVTW